MVLVCACSAVVPISVQQYVQLQDNIPTTTGARVFFIGDTQRTSVIEAWRERNHVASWKLIRQTVRKKPDALILLGDLVFWGSSEEEWLYLDTLLYPVRAKKIPVATVMGNHDYYGADAAALWEMERRFGGTTDSARVLIIDSVAYVLLNTNREDISVKQMAEQRKWFVKTVQQADKNSAIVALVVCGHHPPFTNNVVVKDEKWMHKTFVPSYLTSKKGLLWLSGHAHGYEHIVEQGKTFVVTAGGGGPRAGLLPPDQSRHQDVSGLPLTRPIHAFEIQRIGKTLQCTMHPEESEKTFNEQFVVSIVE